MNQKLLISTVQDGYHFRFMGSTPIFQNGKENGYRFTVWAPNANNVSVVGDFNDWDEDADLMQRTIAGGIWTIDIPEATEWDRYKYCVDGKNGSRILKQDPYARHCETRPQDASICYNPDDFEWKDKAYMEKLPSSDKARPLNIYEVHLGSWRRYPDHQLMNYRKLGKELALYCKEMGYTHVELMPVMEHPLDASWGYQVSCYYAVTSRFGTPADFKYMIDYLHRKGIGVILDWVPAHFPKNQEGLSYFDGTPCYEYEDPRIGEHKTWGTSVFNYSKKEVQDFLVSNAVFWFSEFHIDGIRVDAVSSMLYRNYDRTEYIPNQYGGVENLEAVAFFKNLNGFLRKEFPYALLMAEESTSWANVTGKEDHALGFTHKWNMGWMHDTLDFFSTDSFARIFHKNQFTFSMMYTFSEQFVLTFSHDEVVHGKKSLIDKMPGDHWRKFASLRVMYLYMMAHPGAKLLFMGSEFGQFIEWREYEELEWFLLSYESHRLLKDFVSALNHFYLKNKALWIQDTSWDGFEWLRIPEDHEECIFAFQRIGEKKDEKVIAVLNMIPAPMSEYRVPVEEAGDYKVVLNSDDMFFGGSGYPMSANKDVVFTAKKGEWKGKDYFIELCLPPLSGIYLMKIKSVEKEKEDKKR